MAFHQCQSCADCQTAGHDGPQPQYPLNPQLDLISLHYDCADDPDDFVSSAADRAMLEATYGTSWLSEHTLVVIGAFGQNVNFVRRPCERVATAVWGDSTEVLAASFHSTATGEELTPPQVIDANRPYRLTAARRAAERWLAALRGGGQIYVKEGGQSDFTKLVVELLFESLGSDGAGKGAVHMLGKCVHVVQHSRWNEQHNMPNVTDWMVRHTDYVGSTENHHGPITDGNPLMRLWSGEHVAADRVTGAIFTSAARQSWMGCAWATAFDEFSQLYSYCDWAKGSQQMSSADCLDFSDSHELSFILRLGDVTIDRFYQRFIMDYQVDASTAWPLGGIERAVDCSTAARFWPISPPSSSPSPSLGSESAETAALSLPPSSPIGEAWVQASFALIGLGGILLSMAVYLFCRQGAGGRIGLLLASLQSQTTSIPSANSLPYKPPKAKRNRGPERERQHTRVATTEATDIEDLD